MQGKDQESELRPGVLREMWELHLANNFTFIQKNIFFK